MVVKTRRRPTGIRRVASGTIATESQRYVIRIGRLVKIGLVASYTGRGGIRIAGRMTVHTTCLQVCTRQRESGLVVIKNVVCIPCRMTSQTG